MTFLKRNHVFSTVILNLYSKCFHIFQLLKRFAIVNLIYLCSKFDNTNFAFIKIIDMINIVTIKKWVGENKFSLWHSFWNKHFLHLIPCLLSDNHPRTNFTNQFKGVKNKTSMQDCNKTMRTEKKKKKKECLAHRCVSIFFCTVFSRRCIYFISIV